MTSFAQIPREGKRRIAGELHDNLAGRAGAGLPDSWLDPFIAQFANARDSLSQHVDGKSNAEAQRSAALVQCDVDDDEVDRWYRHLHRYTEVESLRRHVAHHALIVSLLDTAYPHGLSHVDDRIPDQNDEVRKTLTAFRDLQFADALSAMELPVAWIDRLDAAVQRSEASFSSYEATFANKSSAVALGRDAEADWVSLVRKLTHTIALRSEGASVEVVEEGKRLLAPLTNAVRQLRTEARARATKRKQG